ncbi:GNAT family acetyltransferase [Geminicoccus harenae]|uniref:GNAT family acetyltransferase n=1 Tax=Geminicoccus harenae TaxID=2498453 RepID=UPI00168B62CD|nr:GNAT family acetyltransferase [Geminicoccus harenae]
MAMWIGPARPEQRQAVVELWQAAGLTVPHNDPVADFDQARGREGSDVLVGMLGARLAGAVMVGHDGHRGWLYYLAVAPELRGRGHGRALVAAAEAWLAGHGIRKVQLMVRADNRAVCGFYARIGYAEAPVTTLAKWLDPPG